MTVLACILFVGLIGQWIWIFALKHKERIDRENHDCVSAWYEESDQCRREAERKVNALREEISKVTKSLSKAFMDNQP